MKTAPASRLFASAATFVRRVFSLMVCLSLLGITAQTVRAAAPIAGTTIGNAASATYTDASGTARTATSNTVTTIVQQVGSFTITADRTATVSPGGQVFFPHVITNTGNGSETYTLGATNTPPVTTLTSPVSRFTRTPTRTASPTTPPRSPRRASSPPVPPLVSSSSAPLPVPLSAATPRASPSRPPAKPASRAPRPRPTPTSPPLLRTP